MSRHKRKSGSQDKRRGGGRPQRRRGIWAGAGLALAALVVAGALLIIPPGAGNAGPADLVVYKSPYCGCCEDWVDHVQDAGFSVRVIERQDMGAVKRQQGIPRRLASCHTAVAGDYRFEGHVPADLMRRFLDQQPDARGLAVPGMPVGSPGMEGPDPVTYRVLSFTDSGETTTYAVREGERR